METGMSEKNGEALALGTFLTGSTERNTSSNVHLTFTFLCG